MKMCDVLLPSILLSETHFHYSNEKSVMADAVERVAGEGFYKGIEISAINNEEDLRRIEKIINIYGIAATQWASSVINDESLDISSIDEKHRRESVGRIKELLCKAAECGMDNLALISGPDPGVDARHLGEEALYSSLCELCDAVPGAGLKKILIEPLDRGAHKKKLLGPTSEAVSIVNRVKKSYKNIGLSWDTAHSALCGENILHSLEQAWSHISQIHLSNAVLDSSSQLYGDHHMHLGEPGFLTIENISRLLVKITELSLSSGFKPYISVEVRTEKGSDPWLTESHGRTAIMEAWDLAVKGKHS